jgi:hypothetical protein
VAPLCRHQPLDAGLPIRPCVRRWRPFSSKPHELRPIASTDRPAGSAAAGWIGRQSTRIGRKSPIWPNRPYGAHTEPLSYRPGLRAASTRRVSRSAALARRQPLTRSPGSHARTFALGIWRSARRRSVRLPVTSGGLQIVTDVTIGTSIGGRSPKYRTRRAGPGRPPTAHREPGTEAGSPGGRLGAIATTRERPENRPGSRPLARSRVRGHGREHGWNRGSRPLVPSGRGVV